MEVLESLKMACSALTANKLRSGLTMLGIAIGNASVIAMVAVGQGAQELAAAQFEALGPNVLFVSLTSRSLRQNLSEKARPLIAADARAIASQVPAVAAVAPELHGNQVIAYQDRLLNGSLIGTTPDYLAVRNFQIAQGRFLNATDLRRHSRVVVLGAGLAGDLFRGQNPVGQQIRIKNLSFQVIGTTAAKGALFGANQDDRAIVPLTTMSYQIVGRTSPYGIPLSLIAFLARDRERVPAAQFQVENLLRLRHQLNRPEDIRIFAQSVVLETAKQTNEGLSRTLAAIASISLLVGGIGVMNIMLVSVTERTQEIGLRKALGGREKDILRQFLIEAVILATAGGIFGIFVGVSGIAVATKVSALTASISLPAIGLAVVVSGGIGLFFGVFPARRAAKLPPIVALRSS